MKRNEIRVTYGEEYKEMTKRLLREAGIAAHLPKIGARIGIKPNLVTPSPASYGATTHPEVVAGIIEFLQEAGHRDITIAEGSWVGDKTAEAFEYCGYQSLAEEYGVRLFDTQKDGSYETDAAGMSLRICNCVRDFDYLINVPVLKGHCQTKMTCALKNMKGLISNEEKRRYHRIGLHEPIAHLNAAIRQDLIVVDHICGDLDFEEGGNPVVKNCVMVALDPVLVDACACSILGYRIDDVPYVRLAENLGIGTTDFVIRDGSFDPTYVAGSVTGDGSFDPTYVAGSDSSTIAHRLLDVSYAVDEVDSCSACYAALLPALDRLKKEGILDRIPSLISIGQGHRGKTGAFGVGDCCSAFAKHVPGCPPSTEDIYRVLREILPSSEDSLDRS